MTTESETWLERLRHADTVHGVAAGAAGVLAGIVALRLWNARLDVPFWYGRDALFFMAVAKGAIEHGWVLNNPDLGAPLGLDLHDFPVADSVIPFLTMKAIGVLTGGSVAATFNLYFVLTFGLAAFSAFCLFRWLRISTLVAGACAALYAIAPYHLLENQGHILESSYYLVPAALYLGLAVSRGDPLFERRAGETRLLRQWASRRTLRTLGLCALVGLTYSLYVAFTLVLVVVPAIVAAVAHRDARRMVAAVVVAGTIGAATLLAVSPVLLYRLDHGPNPDNILKRTPQETEELSINLTQLVMPIPGHRIAALDKLQDRYRHESVAGGEWEPLGLAATIGLCLLLFVAVVALVRPTRGPPEERDSSLDDVRYRHLSLLTVTALAFATTGGVSSIVAWTISPNLRSWGRIAIFIALLSLAALGILVDRSASGLRRRWRVPPLALACVLGAFFALCFLDQTSSRLVPDYKSFRHEWRADQHFVDQIDQRLPAGASVFQLPYVAFPEGYANYWVPFTGYLHSKKLRWSYASMRGRPADWQAGFVNRPLSELLPAISAIGFQGLWLDRVITSKDGARIQAELSRIIGNGPVAQRDDGAYVFWDLRPYNRRFREGRSKDQVALLAALSLGQARAKLETRDGQEVIALDPGGDVPIAPDAARGVVEGASASGDELVVSGWATNAGGQHAAERLIVLSDGHLLATGRPDEKRPDVAQANGKGALLSGYRLTARTEDAGRLADLSRLRVFAVVDGQASELKPIASLQGR